MRREGTAGVQEQDSGVQDSGVQEQDSGVQDSAVQDLGVRSCCPALKSVPPQMSNELKQRSLENSAKEEKMEVRKKSIRLLPDADNTSVQLQVRPEGAQACPGRWARSVPFMSLTAARGGEQREASGEPGLPVGETPRSAHPGTPPAKGGVQPPRREPPAPAVAGVSPMEPFRLGCRLRHFVAGIVQEVVRSQGSARQNPLLHGRSQGKRGHVQTTGNGPGAAAARPGPARPPASDRVSAGGRAGRSPSGRVSLGVHSEDPGNRGQHQEAEGGDNEGGSDGGGGGVGAALRF